MSKTQQKTTLHQRYGEWALVTGASDGIGRAFALELAKEGISVAIAARRKEKLQAVETEIRNKYKVDVMVVPVDLSHSAGVEALYGAIGSLDIGIMIASAGFGTSGPFISSDLESELEMIDLNCRALAQLTYRFGQRFARRGYGGIVLMSSLVAFQGVPRAANYAATKAYVQTFAEGLQHELKSLGVDVLAVAPGPVNSGFGARADMNMSQAQTPEEVASGALKALGKRNLVRPGFLAKFLEFSLSMMPRSGRVRIMGKVMGQMTSHQPAKPLQTQ